MKISNTQEIIDYISKSDNLSIKISLGEGEKALWCPSWEAQNSKNPESISDSICETFFDLDCHLRNVNSIRNVEATDYGRSHIFIGTAKSKSGSNITPEFVEKLASVMSKKWADAWNLDNEDEVTIDDSDLFGDNLGMP